MAAISMIAYVSPAHAGIDLPDDAGGLRLRRFPRPRGDRPQAEIDLESAKKFPPPTRG